MKSLLNKILTIGALVTLGSVTLLSSGCGDLTSVDGQDCNQQSDCGSDGRYKCVPANSAQPKKFTCQRNCEKEQKADSSFCTNNESCTEFKGSDNKKIFACVPKAKTGEKCGTAVCKEYESCNSAKLCEPKDCKTNPATACGTTGQCNPKTKTCEKKGATDAVKESYKYIVVKDLTTDASDKLCTDSDSGSDITGISVVNKDGTVVGWAKGVGSIGNAVKDPTISGSDISHIDGSALTPRADKQECILDGLGKNSGHFYTLGCGGAAAFQLMVGTSAGEVKTGDKIRVYEYSSQVCSNQTLPKEDKYAVYVCKTLVNGQSELDDPAKCKKIGGENSVYAEIEVN